MKYDVQFTNQFKKDLKLAEKQNKNLNKLFEVIEILANGETLDARYRDHDLTDNYHVYFFFPALMSSYAVIKLCKRYSVSPAFSLLVFFSIGT